MGTGLIGKACGHHFHGPGSCQLHPGPKWGLVSSASVSPPWTEIGRFVSRLQEGINWIRIFMVEFKPPRISLIINVMKTACAHTHIHIYIHSHMKCSFFSVLKHKNQYTPPCLAFLSVPFAFYTSHHFSFSYLLFPLLPNSCPLLIPSFPLLSLLPFWLSSVSHASDLPWELECISYAMLFHRWVHMVINIHQFS